MGMIIRLGLLVLGLSVLTPTFFAFSQNQNTSPRPDGWQGPWPDERQGAKPAPQREDVPSGPQRSSPAGPQVMEVPSHPQSSTEPPRQQAAIPSRPQQQAPQPQQSITVTVTDQQGRYVAGLQKEDFEVYDDDEPQKITYFNTGEKEPFSMGILVDTSGSMHSKIDRARFALRRLIDSIRPGDEVFIEEFNTRPRLLQDFTDSRVVLARAVALLRPDGGTALYDAILDGLRRVLQGRSAKKTLFIISDGADTRSYNSLEQAISLARRAGVLVYAIGISDFNGSSGSVRIGPFSLGGGGAEDERGNRTLHEMAEQTGGRLFTMTEHDILSNDPVLDNVARTIARELRAQYSLGYTPTKRGSHYRNVRVKVKGKDAETMTVRAQKGHGGDSQAQATGQREPRMQRW